MDDLLPPSPDKAKELGFVGPAHIDVAQATDYYKTPRGRSPHGMTQGLFSGMEAMYQFDAFHLAEYLLAQPLQVVIGGIPGEFGAYRDGHEIYTRARSKDKTCWSSRTSPTTTCTTSRRRPARLWMSWSRSTASTSKARCGGQGTGPADGGVPGNRMNGYGCLSRWTSCEIEQIGALVIGETQGPG